MRKFQYKYSAPTAEERKEIAAIRSQYTTRETADSKLQRLRDLDARVKNTATCLGIAVGVGFCLVFGLGLSIVLVWKLWLFGILVSVIGGVGMAAAQPVYALSLKRGKKRYGEEILLLSEQLLNGEE